MDKKIVAVKELLEQAQRRHHDIKKKMCQQVLEHLEKGQESHIQYYLDEQQKKYRGRADAESSEVIIGLSELRKALK